MICAARTGIHKAAVYNWHRKEGGVEVADAKRLKALETKTARLERGWPSG
ncbi:transposase [Aestuariibius insulae]